MKYFVLILMLIGFFSCKKSTEPSYAKKNLSQEIHPGKKLMETRCYVCHSPTSSHEDRIAPPMIAVKKHYISEGTTKEAFIASMQNWIKNPTVENSKMRGAVKRFGVMPKQYFSEKNIKEISDYLFDNDIEEPEWFQEHYKEERGKGNGKGKGMNKGNGKGNHQGNGNGNMMEEAIVNDEALSHSERGLKYALATKAVLGKNLMGKIQKEGTLEALKFCNTKAYPLTDSMAVVHKASIKRVSDKPRNPNNKANEEELGYIQIFKNNIENNKESQPIVVESLEKVNVYYPITTNGMCLQCHGTPKKQISDNTFSEIQKLYPSDKAVGYDVNQVRGIWNVSFTK